MPRAAKSGSWIMLNPILFPFHGGRIDACSSFFYRLTNCKSSFTGKPSLAAVLNWEEYISCLSCCIQFQLPRQFCRLPFFQSHLQYPLVPAGLPALSGVAALLPLSSLFFLAIIYKLSIYLLFTKVSCPVPCLNPHQRSTTALVTDSLLILFPCVFFFFLFFCLF